jgi:hypothetical protein
MTSTINNDDVDTGSQATATLFVWYRTNKEDRAPPSRPERLGGHVGLRIDHAGESAYLGWWPEYFRVDQGRPQLSKWPLAKLRRFTMKSKGWQSKCDRKPSQADGLGVNHIDSVLVRGKEVPQNAPLSAWLERLPDRDYQWPLSPDGAVAGIEYIKSFDSSGSYHAVLRNCATVCVEALRVAGVELELSLVQGMLPYWCPYRLWLACERQCPTGSAATRR